MKHCALSQSALFFSMLLLVTLGVGLAQPQPATETFTLRFVAVVEERGGHERFVGVRPHPRDLERIRLLPGDRIRYNARPPVEVKVEKWSQQFYWTETRTRRRALFFRVRIVTTFNREVDATLRLSWGETLTPTVTLGTSRFTVGTSASDLVTTQYFDGLAPMDCTAGMTLSTPRVDRDPQIPADAEVRPLVVETLYADGQVLPRCQVELVVTRAAPRD